MYDIVLSPNAQFALSRGFDGFGKLWDLSKDREVLPLFTYAFLFSKDGKLFASAPKRQPGVLLAQVEHPEAKTTLAKSSSINIMAFNASGEILAVGGTAVGKGVALFSGIVSLWNTKNHELLWEWMADDRKEVVTDSVPTAIAFSSDGKSLLVACSNNTVVDLVELSVSQHKVGRTWRVPASDRVSSVSFIGSDGQYILAYAYLKQDVQTELKPVESLLFERKSDRLKWRIPGVVTLDVSRWLGAVATERGDVLLFDAQRGEAKAQMRCSDGCRRWELVSPAQGSKKKGQFRGHNT
jgi:WD40 repeat protein